jgi:hypothetical protein
MAKSSNLDRSLLFGDKVLNDLDWDVALDGSKRKPTRSIPEDALRGSGCLTKNLSVKPQTTETGDRVLDVCRPEAGGAEVLVHGCRLTCYWTHLMQISPSNSQKIEYRQTEA